MGDYSVEFTKTYTTGTYTPTVKVRITVEDSEWNSTNRTSKVTLKKVEYYSSVIFSTVGMPLIGRVTLNGETVADFQGGSADTVAMTNTYSTADYGTGTYGNVTVSHDDTGAASVTIGVDSRASGDWSSSHVFGAWAYTVDNSKLYGVDKATQSKAITKQAAKTYTISYNATGGSGAPAAQTKTYNVALTLSSTKPSKSTSTDATYTITYNYNGNGQSSTTATASKTTSYSFSKWNTAADGSGTSYNPGGSYTANAAAILYARWASSTSTSSVTLPSPTRTGYTFAGWYDAASGGTKIGNGGASYTPTATKTLYAHWTINSYTVTCKDYVGSTSGTFLGSNTASYNYGSSVSGASFGSNTAYDAYYTGYHYTSSSSAVTVTGATTVYRYFALNTWTISYNDNTGNSSLAWYGMTVTNMPSSQTKTYGSNATLSSKVPIIAAEKANGSFTVTYDSRGGSVCSASTANKTMSFTFSHWYASPQKVSYSPGDTYSTNADTVMYAQFSKTDHTASVTLPTTTRTGYTFSGWYTAASGGNKVGNAGASYTPTADVTLYAHWTRITYTVSYAANGGSSTPASQTFDYGGSVTLSAAISRGNASAGSYTVTLKYHDDATADGTKTASRTTKYTFTNWKATDNTTYSAGATYSVNASTTMTAQWSPTTTTAAVTLPNPTRTGYDFKGWYTAATGGTKKANGGASYTPSATETLHAQWSLKTFKLTISQGTGSTISVIRNGSPLSNNATITYGDQLVISFSANTGYNLGTHKVNNSTWTSGQTLTVTAAVSVTSTATPKTFSLSTTVDQGVTLNIQRTSSPIGGAPSGLVYAGDTLYYGDVLKILFAPDSGVEIVTSTINGVTLNSGAVHTVTSANVVIVITAQSSALVYIGDGEGHWGPYQIFIGNGTSWDQYQAFIGDGQGNWIPY